MPVPYRRGFSSCGAVAEATVGPATAVEECADATSAGKARESERRNARERRAVAREVKLGKAGDVLPFAGRTGVAVQDEDVQAPERSSA